MPKLTLANLKKGHENINRENLGPPTVIVTPNMFDKINHWLQVIERQQQTAERLGFKNKECIEKKIKSVRTLRQWWKAVPMK